MTQRYAGGVAVGLSITTEVTAPTHASRAAYEVTPECLAFERPLELRMSGGPGRWRHRGSSSRTMYGPTALIGTISHRRLVHVVAVRCAEDSLFCRTGRGRALNAHVCSRTQGEGTFGLGTLAT